MHKKLGLILTFIFIATLHMSCSEQQKFALEFNTKSQKTLKYELSGELQVIINESDSLPQAATSRYYAILNRNLDVFYNDGSARFVMQADTISYRSNQRSVEECRHIEQVLLKQHIGFKMNPHGELLNFSHSGDVPLEQQTVNDLGRMLLKIQPVLPAFLVVEGSTWETEQVIPNEKGNDGLMYKWFRVQKIQIEESKVLALIDVNIKYRMATEEASDRVSFSHEDFLLGAGQIRFNISEGLIEQADVEISGRIKAMAKDLDPELPPMRVRQMLKMRVIP